MFVEREKSIDSNFAVFQALVPLKSKKYKPPSTLLKASEVSSLNVKPYSVVLSSDEDNSNRNYSYDAICLSVTQGKLI